MLARVLVSHDSRRDQDLRKLLSIDLLIQELVEVVSETEGDSSE